MYKAEERSYRVYRATWDAIRDGAKNYPVLEGELGGYINTITVDLKSFDPDEGVEIDLLDTGRSFTMTLDECVKHGYFSRFYELKCTIAVTAYRTDGSHDQANSSIRIHFAMTTLQLIRTLKPDERVLLPDVPCTGWRWKDALDSDISGLEETEIMVAGIIDTATGVLRFDSRPYGIALDVTGHVTPAVMAVMTIIEKEPLRRWDVLVSDYCQVIRKYNGKDSDEAVAVIFDEEAKKIRQILVPGNREKIQAYGLGRRVLKDRAHAAIMMELDNKLARIMANSCYGISCAEIAHSGRYPWGSGESSTQTVPGIKKVYFNKPATVVIWEDGSKTIVKCQPGEKYDAEKGLAMAIAKKALGNTGKWYDTFKKELPKPKKRSSAKKGATDETA